MSDALHDRLKTLEREWKTLLQHNLFGLCKHIEPDNGLIDNLLSAGVLNKKAAESFRVKNTKYNCNQAILEFIHRRPFKDFVKFAEALCKTEQEHIVDSFFYPGGIDAMMLARTVDNVQDCRTQDENDASPDANYPQNFLQNFDWRHHIKKHLTCLSEVIDPDHGLIPALAHRQVIQEWIMDKYLKPEGRCARVQKILLELISKSDRHFLQFRDSLVESNQSHIVTDYLNPDSVECYRHSLQRSITYPVVGAAVGQIAPNWKTLLMKKRSSLTDMITPSEDLINCLESLGVMNKHCVEHCKEILPEYKRTEFILNYLQTRPDRDFSAFCTALEQSDQKHVIDEHLQEENLSPAVQESTSEPSTPFSHLELGNNNRSCGCVPQEENCQGEVTPAENRQVPQQDANGDGRSVGECINGLTVATQCTSSQEQTAVQEVQSEDSHFILGVRNVRPQLTECTESNSLDSGFGSHADSERISMPSERLDQNRTEDLNIPVVIENSLYPERPTPIHDVQVLHSTHEFYAQNHAKSYAMSRAVRGRCIIFNNHKFIRMNKRKGTNIDGELLCKLFQKLSFSVEEIKDASSQEIKSKLYDISRDESLENDHCLAVFILSHGDYRNGKCIIFGSDDNSFMLDDILNLFAPNNCRQLRGKPKLVFIQACRGDRYDFTHTDASFDGEGEATFAYGESEEQRVLNSYPDFLIAYPTQAGYRAFRDIEYGTWYINALTRVFMANAHFESLNSMMNQVSGVASRWLSRTESPETDNKTQYAIYTCSFTKDLFFFPGIVK